MTDAGPVGPGVPANGHPWLTSPVEAVDVAGLDDALFPPVDPVRPPRPVTQPTDDEPLVPLPSAGRLQGIPGYAMVGWVEAPAVLHVRGSVLRALRLAVDALPDSLGMTVLDAWRPPVLQRALRAGAQGQGLGDYVADADGPVPAPHSTGGAVDVTLSSARGPLALGTAWDSFTDAARPEAFEGVPGPVRLARRVMHAALCGAGFVVHPLEWWHVELGTHRWASISGSEPWYGSATPT